MSQSGYCYHICVATALSFIPVAVVVVLISPLVAVRYQIMVMCMIFGAAGLSTVCFLMLIRKTEHFN